MKMVLTSQTPQKSPPTKDPWSTLWEQLLGTGCGVVSGAQLAVNQPNTKVSALVELTFSLGRNK